MGKEKIKKPFYKKVWFWVVAVIIVGGLATSGGSEETEPEQQVPVANESNESTKDTPTTLVEDTKEKSEDEPKEEVEQEAKKESYKAGMYKVGADLEAGEYYVVAEGAVGAYVEVAKDSSGTLDSIIGNANVASHTFVTVEDGQYLNVKYGKFYKADDADQFELVDGMLEDGVYRVGIDVPAGEYKVIPTGDFVSYVAIWKSSKMGLDSIVTNDILDGEKYITLSDGQYVELNGASLKVE